MRFAVSFSTAGLDDRKGSSGAYQERRKVFGIGRHCGAPHGSHRPRNPDTISRPDTPQLGKGHPLGFILASSGPGASPVLSVSWRDLLLPTRSFARTAW